MNDRNALIRVNGVQRRRSRRRKSSRLGHVAIGTAPEYQATAAGTRGFRFHSQRHLRCCRTAARRRFHAPRPRRQARGPSHARAVETFLPKITMRSFEVIDADAVGMGKRSDARTRMAPAWGMGRHILGSQIFDYWGDPWGDQARALLRRRPVHRRSADRRPPGEPRKHGAMGPADAEGLRSAQDRGGLGARAQLRGLARLALNKPATSSCRS